MKKLFINITTCLLLFLFSGVFTLQAQTGTFWKIYLSSSNGANDSQAYFAGQPNGFYLYNLKSYNSSTHEFSGLYSEGYTIRAGGDWNFSQRVRLNGSNAGLWIEAGTNDWFVGRNSSTGSSLRFYNNGDQMTLSADGRLSLGIGTATASNSLAKFTVKSGDIHLEGGAFSSHGTLNFRPDTDNTGDDAIVFKNNAEAETMRIHTNNNVGIGTSNPLAKLHVNGTARLAGALTGTSANFSGRVQANSLTLNVGSFPDYVFAKNYDLMPLEQVEAYINANHHLPKVPKAAKVEKEGMNVAQINVLLVEKVEELTLHLIEQNKQMKQMQQKMQALEKKVQNLKK
ncbi:hypothetical protein [uncultured Microscilla sp.]|uniref:hypothetical protein n=1 Tax=uncultured Microscilla sp. TaxID=432653 RepID=UPI0026164EB8|nr:hypothetical protein [uncultured Microscilla sp.]